MNKNQENARVETMISIANKIHDNVGKLTTILRKNSYKSEESRLAEATDRLLADLVGAMSDLRDPSPEETVTEKPDRWGRGTEREETHESFGCLQFNRVSGDRKLFGSSVLHRHFITLRILRAKAQYRALDSEMTAWPDMDADSHIVECCLSAAQFAEAITAMNIGQGVPCTLTDVRGRAMARVPDTHTNQANRVVNDFKKSMQTTEEDSSAAFDALVKEIEASSLSKKAQAAMIKKAEELHSRHDDRAEFVLNQFNESAETRMSQVKTELDATLSLFTQQLGLRQLQELRKEDLLPATTSDGIIDIKED